MEYISQEGKMRSITERDLAASGDLSICPRCGSVAGVTSNDIPGTGYRAVACRKTHGGCGLVYEYRSCGTVLPTEFRILGWGKNENNL